ncbi:MAG: hypothetical protein LBH06_05795 [Rikenellaceae bacterium]|jgi:rubrerythrin|nr:hypothetical protein [Rikenellaceae bacterium]
MWTKIITNILGFGLSLLFDAVKQCRHKERFLSLEDVVVDEDVTIEEWKCTKCGQSIRKIREFNDK